MSQLIISVSGLRGIVGETLTPEVAGRYAASFATTLPHGSVIIGRDGRTTGSMLGHAVTAALLASGRDVVDAGVIATPTLGVLVRHLKAAGGIQISASHNPPAYNGMKLFSCEGRVLPADLGSAVRQTYQSQSPTYCSFDRVGHELPIDDPHSPHLKRVLATVDVDAIRKHSYRVLLDSNHGAGGLLGKRLLNELNCAVEAVGIELTGLFAHVPEPTQENLVSVTQMVTQTGSSVGFCQDPDADRLALIDETGRYIGEECTLALCVQWAILTGRSKGSIVINGATSSMSQSIAQRNGLVAYRSAVGEANVVDQMIHVDAVYGGEGNGGPIDPRVGFVRDSFVGMAQVLDLMARTQKPLSQLADELPKFAIVKDKATFEISKLPRLFERLIAHFEDADWQTDDGLRLAWSDRWLLIRGSNTEPIIRIISEAPQTQDAMALIDAVKRMLD